MICDYDLFVMFFRVCKFVFIVIEKDKEMDVNVCDVSNVSNVSGISNVSNFSNFSNVFIY